MPIEIWGNLLSEIGTESDWNRSVIQIIQKFFSLQNIKRCNRFLLSFKINSSNFKKKLNN